MWYYYFLKEGILSKCTWFYMVLMSLPPTLCTQFRSVSYKTMMGASVEQPKLALFLSSWNIVVKEILCFRKLGFAIFLELNHHDINMQAISFLCNKSNVVHVLPGIFAFLFHQPKSWTLFCLSSHVFVVCTMSTPVQIQLDRSEERRVGKECRN